MTDRGQRRELKPVPGLVFGLAGALATACIAALTAFTAPQPADALPAYAQQTGLACGRCHVNPAGGGARTSFGNAFAANGHKVPSKGAKPGKTSAKEGAPAAAPAAPTTSAARPIDLYYAQAQSLSFRRPYYSHFLYRPDDYRD
jgi:mono/diheme cytochrome c family protein